ncbi:MAG: hypothetical protein KGY66_03855 [Candidatus Thermoplasmatota archaeon]|nr:hypothetical protein [Candidatus Thermoplasmatota archaeon]
MCRYEFGDGKCSYPNNMALECVGEDKCRFVENSDNDSPPKIMGDEDRSRDSSKTAPEDDGCPNTKTGIYCKKYGYFHCAGKENCEDPEDYMEHLERHRDKFQNIDINKNVE